MLRFFFWLFLLINLGFGAYQLGYFGNLGMDSSDPNRAGQQINAQKLVVVSPEIALAAPPAPKLPDIACIEIGNFQLDDASGVESKLSDIAFGERQSRINTSDAASYMVYIPSLGNKEAADRKSGELQRLGIKDFFIIQDQSNLRWGVSLGVFKTEEAARQQLNTLSNKGVRTARVGPRSVGQRVAYQFHQVSADEKTKLETIRSSLPQHEERECSANKTEAPKSEVKVASKPVIAPSNKR
jgi:hypothetical protein